jgi:hypothetical protein
MSAMLEEAIEEMRTLPPKEKQHLRELSDDFSELLGKANIRDLLIMALLFWALGKKLDESNLDELRSQLEKLSNAPPQGLLTEGAGARVARDLTREQEWIDAHRNEHLGEWVVVEGDRLIVNGHDARTVYNAARDAGIEAPFLIRVKPANTLPFGGW